MSSNELDMRIDKIRSLKRLIEVSAPVIKCQKTPRKKCNLVAEVKKKR